mmetsp:Transcript_101340/g.292000  ORF Transcript_101340/g.292000 Transcript_101340/m.292000 type:complete len:261 (-) Transcript_101340:53-835(-)
MTEHSLGILEPGVGRLDRGGGFKLPLLGGRRRRSAPGRVAPGLPGKGLGELGLQSRPRGGVLRGALARGGRFRPILLRQHRRADEAGMETAALGLLNGVDQVALRQGALAPFGNQVAQLALVVRILRAAAGAGADVHTPRGGSSHGAHAAHHREHRLHRVRHAGGGDPGCCLRRRNGRILHRHAVHDEDLAPQLHEPVPVIGQLRHWDVQVEDVLINRVRCGGKLPLKDGGVHSALRRTFACRPRTRTEHHPRTGAAARH